MLKKLLSSCLDAYRGSHKSVVAGRYIATDLSFPTGCQLPRPKGRGFGNERFPVQSED